MFNQLRINSKAKYEGISKASTSLILVALGTAPLEATPGMSEGWRQAITWLELRKV